MKPDSIYQLTQHIKIPGLYQGVLHRVKKKRGEIKFRARMFPLLLQFIFKPGVKAAAERAAN